MRILTIIFLLFTFLSTNIYSQVFVGKDGTVYDQRNKTQTRSTNTSKMYKNTKNSNGFDVSKLSLGGNLGVQLGDYTMINIAPQLGYDIIPQLTLGAGLGYTYLKDDDRYYDYKNSYLSFNIFARYYPIEYVVLSVQPEISRLWSTIEGRGIKYSDNKFVPTLVVGGGLRYQNIIAMIQYDVIQNDNSPYGDTIFYTVGYCFNF